ncbi:Lacal_2735 family protein [Thalassobellus citreus]|uniref:Lacal_2735 family protein n=1 Tax=Thalassobellus citreus TaxID=3367752 RepID=UPI0037AC07D5
MFGLFKKKTESEKLQKKYKSLMAEWHKLSSINRAESDKKYAEAEAVLKQIETLKQ